MKTLTDSIKAVLEGNLHGLSSLQDAIHSDLLEAATRIPELIITRSALIRVIKAWQSGQFTADQVSQWASFVRRGYISNITSGGLQPIDIVYDKLDEDLIVEIIGRFDEIGDLIDGNIGNDEQEEMLRYLKSSCNRAQS